MLTAQSHTMAWVVSTFFLLLSIGFILIGFLIKSRDAPKAYYQIYWFCAVQSFSFALGGIIVDFFSGSALGGIRALFPFLLAIFYSLWGLALQSRILWYAGMLTPGVWYIVQALFILSAPFYFPDFPYLYAIIGVSICCLAFWERVTARLPDVTKITFCIGIGYVLLAVLLLVSEHREFLFKNVSSIITVVFPISLFIWGMDALRKHPDSSKGDWILFAAAHALTFCILLNGFTHTSKIVPLTPLLFPFMAAAIYMGIAFIFKSSSWWLVAITTSVLWAPFFGYFLQKTPLISWQNIFVLSVSGVGIVFVYLLWRKKDYIQDVRKETYLLTGLYLCLAVIMLLHLGLYRYLR